MEEHILVSRILGLTVMTVPEFGTRAGFRLEEARGDIARKHRVSRFTLTTGRRGQWEPIMKEN